MRTGGLCLCAPSTETIASTSAIVVISRGGLEKLTAVSGAMHADGGGVARMSDVSREVTGGIAKCAGSGKSRNVEYVVGEALDWRYVTDDEELILEIADVVRRSSSRVGDVFDCNRSDQLISAIL